MTGIGGHTAPHQRAKGNSGGPSVLVSYGLLDCQRLRECGLRGAFVPDWGIR